MTREGFLKHKELIEAWANGAEVQYLTNDGEWCDCYNSSQGWFERTEYRIKPREPNKKTIILETWLLRSDYDEYYTFECSLHYPYSDVKVKLLSTREVEIDED